MYCPECGAEYRESFTECSDCQVMLVSQLSEEVVGREVQLVRIFKAENLITLALAEAILDQEGIVYTTVGQRLYAAGFPINRPVWIEVPSQDKARAQDALAHLGEA